MPEASKLDILIKLIKNDGVKFVVGIEKDGVRHCVKSERSAAIIGGLYRAALKEERPEELPNKRLPFPGFWEGQQIKSR
jgi:hypothetical protein